MRVLSGLIGLVILLGYYNSLFIEHKGFFTIFGNGGGYYSPLMPFAGIYMSLIFLAYSLDAQKFLRIFAPPFAKKKDEEDKR